MNEGHDPIDAAEDAAAIATSEATALADADSAAHVAGAYAVKLPVFEGPLDLLLHLIRQNEVEITDIPVARVGEQYLEYLELMRELNLDVAAEYLVMAATLALIKSRMLLPPEPGEDEAEAIDPRAELVARLLEYQRFKEVAEELGKRRLLGRDVYAAEGPGPEPVPEAEREIAVNLFQLLQAFKEVLEDARGEPSAAHEIEQETVTVRDRMISVMDVLETADSMEFRQLFLEADGHAPSRAVLVATFLAILELARLHALRLYQDADGEGMPTGPIRLRGLPADATTGAPRWSDRISDLM